MATVYYTASSLDGFLATEDDGLDWLFPLADIADTGYDAFVAGVGAIAMGAATFRWMLRHVVKPGSPDGSPWPYEQPVWVFSHGPMPTVPGADIRPAQGDVRPVHARMVEAAGRRDVWLVGGGDLVGQFHDAGLLDAVVVQVGSVTLGRGKPLLPRRLPPSTLSLVAARRIGPGMAELRYDVVRPADRASSLLSADPHRAPPPHA